MAAHKGRQTGQGYNFKTGKRAEERLEQLKAWKKYNKQREADKGKEDA